MVRCGSGVSGSQRVLHDEPVTPRAADELSALPVSGATGMEARQSKLLDVEAVGDAAQTNEEERHTEAGERERGSESVGE